MLTGCFSRAIIFQKAARGAENFETFCLGVGKFLGLGGSKYRPRGRRQAGRDSQETPSMRKKKPGVSIGCQRYVWTIDIKDEPCIT